MSDESNPPPQTGSGFDANKPTIISLLYLASFVTGATALIGIVLAYVWQSDVRGSWEESHIQFLIRTFWIGLVGFIISGILFIVLIGIPLMIAVAAWVGVRSVVSLAKAQRHEPIPNPATLLI